MIIIVMGVSGSGKSTIGVGVAARLGLAFVEGDAYHPQANIDKMAAGHPLDDDDRRPWLLALADVLAEAETAGGCVLACSALKASYRELLSSGLSAKPIVLFLDGSRELLAGRLRGRSGHFFPPHLLASQFETLEEPADAIRLDLRRTPAEIIDDAVTRIRAR